MLVRILGKAFVVCLVSGLLLLSAGGVAERYGHSLTVLWIPFLVIPIAGASYVVWASQAHIAVRLGVAVVFLLVTYGALGFFGLSLINMLFE
jgi:hypothetical protein